MGRGMRRASTAPGKKYPLLVVDAGNSAVKFALVARPGAAPKPVGSIPTAQLTVSAARRMGAEAKSVVVCSVVPEASRILKGAFPAARFIGPRTPLGFRTKTDRATIGSDRLANVAAAYARYGRNVLIASFGTAATFDVLDAAGVHRGGAIAPGWKSFAALASAQTAQLPRIDARAPSRTIGRNTREALRAGVNGGYAALVCQLIAQIRKEAGLRKARVILTGGDAPLVAALTGIVAVTDPLLNLKGIALLAAAGVREGRR